MLDFFVLKEVCIFLFMSVISKLLFICGIYIYKYIYIYIYIYWYLIYIILHCQFQNEIL